MMKVQKMMTEMTDMIFACCRANFPRWVMIENVPGITSLNDGLYIEWLLDELDKYIQD